MIVANNLSFFNGLLIYGPVLAWKWLATSGRFFHWVDGSMELPFLVAIWVWTRPLSVCFYKIGIVFSKAKTSNFQEGKQVKHGWQLLFVPRIHVLFLCLLPLFTVFFLLCLVVLSNHSLESLLKSVCSWALFQTDIIIDHAFGPSDIPSKVLFSLSRNWSIISLPVIKKDISLSYHFDMCFSSYNRTNCTNYIVSFIIVFLYF